MVKRLLVFATALASATMASATPKALENLDVVWKTPSENAAGSMPIGNGETVLNVWVERTTGDILFYIGRTDALSEISRMLKLGRVRVHLSPSPFASGRGFEQRLRLSEGEIVLKGEGESLRLFVDPGNQAIHLRGHLLKERDIMVSIETWREKARKFPADEGASAWSASGAPVPLIESADVFQTIDSHSIAWYHRNETSIVPTLWTNQALTGLKGTFDPLLHRTFGGIAIGKGLVASGPQALRSLNPVKELDLTIGTHSAQVERTHDWLAGATLQALQANPEAAEARNRRWWHEFWNRSWVFVVGDEAGPEVPANSFPLRTGVDSNGHNVFPGAITRWAAYDRPINPDQLPPAAGVPSDFTKGFTLAATIRPEALTPGRIFDKLTAGKTDGFLFDTHPGDSLRLIVGDLILNAPHCLVVGEEQTVAAVYDSSTGEAAIYRNGIRIAHQPAAKGSLVTKGYVLQRYVQACQGRGAYPIKFNGGTFTVEPAAMGKPFNADWRNWGDAHWFQNVRHMYHPMLASADYEMMEPFFHLYESVRPLAESRTKLYHHAEGAYFPETMTPFGTYAGKDFGWDRRGLQPNDVQSPWWRYAWNQGPELVALMLDRWDQTRDDRFLKTRLLPMAESVLRYFDTRFRKDAAGKIVLDPTQVVETYWTSVVNDMPSTAGLIAITNRLCALPVGLLSNEQRAFFARMKAACPDLPLETKNGKRTLAPAQKYDPKTSNVENGELYAVWPFRLVSLSHPALLAEARQAYADRKFQLPVGWGYDGNVAALLGLTDEAARILRLKVSNSNPAYRWPATWGPNFDWLPDQNHGGNLLNTTNLMLLQADPLEEGGAIRVLPAWPKNWDVDFKLHAPGNTVVRCVYKNGRIAELEVTPKSRRKNVMLPNGLSATH